MSASLRYTTNSDRFDFPPFEGEPQTRYVIASTPRCGSNFLQRALWRTGKAGAPEEYLTSAYVSDFVNRKEWAPVDSPFDVDDHVRRRGAFVRRRMRCSDLSSMGRICDSLSTEPVTLFRPLLAASGCG